MVATVILGSVIAVAFGYGLRTIYRNFFKAEAVCCKTGGAECHCCDACASAKKN